MTVTNVTIPSATTYTPAMTPPLPPEVAAAVPGGRWPSDPAQRATISRGLRGAARVALIRWAHAVAQRECDPVTSAACGEVLGLPQSTIRDARHRHAAELAGLVWASGGMPRRDDAEISDHAKRARARRAKAATAKRRAKTST